MDDAQIINLYFARDENAIVETQNKYQNMCYIVAHNILYSREDSEECVNAVSYTHLTLPTICSV